MNIKTVVAFLVIFSIWTSLFAPFVLAQNTENGLSFRMSEAKKSTKPKEKPTPAKVEKLNETEANEIFRRLPPMLADQEENADFKMLSDSLKPPKSGTITKIKFPADEKKDTPNLNDSDATPIKDNLLEIENFTPNGNVENASYLSVSFSQPMISITSQTMASENIPIKITPEVKGKWRWIGTQTLVFDAETRFPMATKFTAKIPANTKSAIGGKLAKDFTWTFSTPPPKVITFLPKGSNIKPDSLIFAAFNQAINQDEILQKINETANISNIKFRLATESEIKQDENISKIINNYQPNNLIIFRSVEPLLTDSRIEIKFAKGLISTEGSLVTDDEQVFSFYTFSKFKLENFYCGWDSDDKECSSYQDLKLEFNNNIDEKSFDAKKIKIEPSIEDAKISVWQNRIEITGQKKPRITYKITFPALLKDEFGQTLGKDTPIIFKTKPDEPQLYLQGNEFVTLDPNAKPIYSIYSRNYDNFRIKLFAVKPKDFSIFQKYQESEDENKRIKIGELIIDKPIIIKGKSDETVETKIDLTPVLTNGYGHAVLEVSTLNPKDNTEVIWIQKTNIGLTMNADYEKFSVFASDLQTAKPIENVKISLLNDDFAITSENGIAEIFLPKKKTNSWLIAQKGFDSAIYFDYYNREDGWSKKQKNDSLRWFVFDDRKIYRPNEEVSIKGYIRRVKGGKFTEIAELKDSINTIFYSLKDSRGNEIAKGSPNINAFGAFDFKIKLPSNINLGNQNLEFTTDSKLENDSFYHRFQVQEFRRPEFEVSAKIETATPFFVGGSTEISAEAKYYSGGFLSNAETKWNVKSTPTDYTPPNRDDFTFGKFYPWWRYESRNEETTKQEFIGETDSEGKHYINLDFISANPSRPYTIEAEAQIKDVNRQTFASSTTLLVHPSNIYVGLRTPKNFVQPNEKFKIETITTDIDGKAISNTKVSIIAELKDWQKIKGEWEKVTIDIQTCEIISTNDIASCEIIAKKGGIYDIKASVLDEKERRNESELSVWVAGGNSEDSDNIEEEAVELIPNKEKYSPNENAEILINSPFETAEGVMTLDRNGIIKTEHFTMNSKSKVLQIPIEESYLPNFHVRIDLVSIKPRIIYEDERDQKLPKRPAYASGELNLQVSTDSSKLNVTVEPQEKILEPSGETKLNVQVTDYLGKAMPNSEVAIVVVDESVLALTNYRIQNPIDIFYSEIDSELRSNHSREDVLLVNPEDIVIGFGNGNGVGYGSGDGRGTVAGYPTPTYLITKNADPFRKLTIINSLQRPPNTNNEINIRRNFDALAMFSPSVITDENGKALVNLKLPDNLTRYRITAVAVTKSKQFGLGESNITAKQSLQIRPSAPRFMNFGDKAELPIVLQNQSDSPLTINVAIRANNANLADANGKKVTVAANDRVEISFPITTQKSGIARFQIGAVSGNFADAAEIEFPIYTPATTENFATYGTTEENGAIIQTIFAPKDVYADFGGLEITTSSTQLQELTDAFIYLNNYPFDCSEQVSSRILSVAALRDVLTAFNAKEMPSKENIEAKMKQDIERLQTLQHSDGGFSFWRSDDESIPYLSVHVVHAIARAKAKNYKIPSELTAKSLNYLRNIESKLPKEYSDESRWAISAYALYVRDLLGEKNTAKTKKLLQDVGLEKLSAESIGWILSVLADDKNSGNEVQVIKQNLLNRINETAGNAHFTTTYKDGEYVLLSSERRADAVILEALIKVESQESKVENKSSLIPKIVRGLLANRVKGRWQSTQENAFVLLALDKYFQTYEKVTPNFVAKIWLGNNFAGEQKFSGRSTNSNLINVPMNYLQTQKSEQNLIVDKKGEGRLYYRIGLKYAPKKLKLDAADYGFKVSRTYEAVDKPDDVKQNYDGSWTIKSGSRVRVRVKMVAPTRRYHVALVDNLPAGIEIINSNLATSSRFNDDEPPKVNSIYRNYWLQHQNLRDNRAEAFTTLLQAGVWNYSYLARATTIGNFIVPPTKAEEMYSPETFGRSKTDFVKVE